MTKINRIAFLGNFTVPYCTEVHHAKTYEKLGIEVVQLQESVATAEEIYQAAKDCDAFCWTHTHGWNTPRIEGVLAKLNELGIPSYGYHLDLWLGIARQNDLRTDPFWKVKYFFSVDPEMVDLLNATPGMPKAFFLPAGVFEDECYMALPNKEKYPHDVIFVGSRGYHPEWPYRAELISWLEKTYGSRFAQYGGGGLGTIRGHELNVLYASAKVVIGDTLCPGFVKPGYFSDRIFETTGRGGMIVHPHIFGISGLFEIQDHGKLEIETYKFGDFEGLQSTIDYLLHHDEYREQIRTAGHERTKKDHTYTQRLHNLIETLENEQQ